jgi:hypothetical protein
MITLTFSQDIVKDTTFLNNDPYLRSTHLLQSNSYYYLFGFSTSRTNDTTSIHLNKVDNNFNQIWKSTTSFKDTSKVLFSEFTYINQLNDINLIGYLADGYTQYLYFETLDSLGKKIYQIDSANLNNNWMGLKGKIFVNYNHNIYHINKWGSNNSAQLRLQTFDQKCKLLNVDTIYRINYPTYNEINVSAVLLTKDSGFVVTGDLYIKAVNKYDIFIQKYDKYKNIVWEKIFKSDSARESTASICETSNGELVLVGYLKPYLKTINKYTHFIRKYNAEGVLLWDKNYFENLAISRSKVIETPDGSYYVVANTFQKSIDNPPDTYYNFCIFKTNNDGGLLWKKIWGKPDVQNYIRDIVFLNNNEIVVSGVQDKYTYIARIKDTTTTNVEDVKMQSINFEIVISPNPALNYISILLNNGLQHLVQSNNYMRIYNSFGENVSSIAIQNPESQQIDISSLPPGLYFVRYGSEYGKFIKE